LKYKTTNIKVCYCDVYDLMICSLYRNEDTWNRWEQKGYLVEGLGDGSLQRLKDKLGLIEPIENFLDKTRLAYLKAQYGTNAADTPIPHFRARFKVRQAAGIDEIYLDFTEIVKLSGIDISSSYAIQSWLRGRGTVELMSLWEQEHNPKFDVAAAEALQNTISILTIQPIRCIVLMRFQMKIHDYHTDGDKNLIKEYLHGLPREEQLEGYRIRHNIINYGLDAFPILNTRQLQGKLWEIKFSDNRIMYIILDKDNVYFLNACQKQKNKAEKFELNKALKRAEELNLL